jgi:hypothetical protein
MSGVLHALRAAAAHMAAPILHLRLLNPYLLSSLTRDVAAHVSIARQARGQPRLSSSSSSSSGGGNKDETSMTGVSSFAFQVELEKITLHKLHHQQLQAAFCWCQKVLL